MLSFISECAPSASFYILLYDLQTRYGKEGLLYSGFTCTKCRRGPYDKCNNCSFCVTGTMSNGDKCVECPAGNNYLFFLGKKTAYEMKCTCRSQIKMKTQLLSFQEVFIRTKWVKLSVRIAAQVLMFLRRNILEKVQLTVVHALMVRTTG